MGGAGFRIFKLEEAAGQVRMGVALQVEKDGLLAAHDPDFPGHDAFGAVVYFTANDAVLDAECHGDLFMEKPPRCKGSKGATSLR